MNRKFFVIVFALLVLFTVFAGCTVDPRAFCSDYDYRVQIQTDNCIKNVTFILPLPVNNGLPTFGDKILKVEDFEKENLSVSFTQSSEGLDLTSAMSSEGYNPWFVVIKADEMVPAKGDNLVYQIKKDVFIGDRQVDEYRFTPSTIGKESLIMPKFNFTWHEPVISQISEVNVRYELYDIPHQTIIYAEYDTSPLTQVKISFSQKGSNGWKQGYDAWYSNSYYESFSETFTGAKCGWYLINGDLGSKESGWYPNPENPAWQKILGNNLEE